MIMGVAMTSMGQQKRQRGYRNILTFLGYRKRFNRLNKMLIGILMKVSSLKKLNRQRLLTLIAILRLSNLKKKSIY